MIMLDCATLIDAIKMHKWVLKDTEQEGTVITKGEFN